MKRLLNKYKTILHGQEVEVSVYEPSTPEDHESAVDIDAIVFGAAKKFDDELLELYNEEGADE